jgi:hypothetical protein
VRAQIGAVMAENQVRVARCEVTDLNELVRAIETWKPVAKAHHLQRAFTGMEWSEAYARLFLGDVVGAHAAMLRLYEPKPQPASETQRIEGSVVDEAGRPIAGASVAAASTVFLDSAGPSPFGQTRGDLRMVTSDQDGRFVIPDAPKHGALVGQLLLRRGFADLAPGATVVLHDTRQVSGKVELGKMPRTKVFVFVVPKGERASTVRLMAPLLPDGTFQLIASKGDLSVAVATWGPPFNTDVEFHAIPAGGDVRDLDLQVPGGNGRTLDVIARSAVAMALDGAQVIIIPGRHRFHTVGDLFKQHEDPHGRMMWRYAEPLVGESIPADARPLARRGDFFLHVDDARTGDLTVCVIGLNGDLSDTAFMDKVRARQAELEVKCEGVGPDDKVVVVEAPPQKRID